MAIILGFVVYRVSIEFIPITIGLVAGIGIAAVTYMLTGPRSREG